MTDHRLAALSPLDGRYADNCAELAGLFSEAALLRYRLRVEAAWVLALAESGLFPPLDALPPAASGALRRLSAGDADAALLRRVKELEATTKHDVKAVEYCLREQLAAAGASDAQQQFVHFACTSEDINNLSYALMLGDARRRVLLPMIGAVADALAALARQQAGLAMLSRTHGQPASPTTLGKELANVVARMRRAADGLGRVELLGKFNGAVGNYNAHVAACPEADWPALTARFVGSLGLVQNRWTTQIEPHDWIAEYCDALARANTVLLDCCRDAWGYVSLGYFRQRSVAGEVGSSTMPHKVNPIDFENAEGNVGISNALLRHLADKLPVSRWQRDLSDSTALRNLGVALGHALLAWRSALRGIGRIEPDAARIAADLDAHWEVLGEAIQTVMRRHGVPGAYERLKEFTRGREVGPPQLREFVAGLGLPDEARRRLEALTPAGYTGLAEALARDC